MYSRFFHELVNFPMRNHEEWWFIVDLSIYPVVNGGSDKRSELGVPIFPKKIPELNNGEPAGANIRPTSRILGWIDVGSQDV